MSVLRVGFMLKKAIIEDDDVHQYIISEETTLMVYNDGSVKNNQE